MPTMWKVVLAIRPLLFCIALALCAAGAMAGQGSARGAWILDSATPVHNVNKDTGAYFNHKFLIRTDIPSASGSNDWQGGNKPNWFVGHVATSVSWTAPPATLTPGQKVPMTVKLSTTASQPSGYRNVGCNVALKLNGMFFGESKCGGPSNEPIKPVTATAQFDVPTGAKGRTLEVYVGIGSAGGNGSVTYKYHWDENATSTAPPEAGTGSTGASTTGTATGTPGVASTSGPSAAERTTIQVAKRSVLPGSKVVVPVWLIKGGGLGSLSFSVTYNAGVAQAIAPVTKGNLLERASFQANPNENAIVRVATAVSGEIGGPDSGTVALLTFQAKGQPGSKTPLHVDVTAASGTPSAPSIAKIDGELVVMAQTSVVPGDSDGDGVLTARDADQALKMDVRLIPENKILDVDSSGKVDSTDARLILRKAVGK